MLEDFIASYQNNQQYKYVYDTRCVFRGVRIYACVTYDKQCSLFEEKKGNNIIFGSKELIDFHIRSTKCKLITY